MKKILTIMLLAFLSLAVSAQGGLSGSSKEIAPQKPFRAPRHGGSGRVVKAVRLPEASLDLTPAITGADKAAAGIMLPQAFDGEGVVMGVTDIGFDFTHPAFASNRISRFWDMLSRDTIGARVFTGRDYTDESEIRSLQHSYDGREETHGTHVLGISSGSLPVYRGLAPAAEIVLVNNVLSNNVRLVDSLQLPKLETEESFLPLEFQYMFDYAESVGKPCVLNISAGSRESFGDDFPRWNAVYSRLTGPGRIIVASAGNEGGKALTLRKQAGQATAGSRLYVNPSGGYAFYQGDAEMELLYSTDRGETKLPLEAEYFEAIDTVSDYDGTAVRYIVFRDSLRNYSRDRLYIRLSGEGEGTVYTQGAEFINSGKDDGWNDASNLYGLHFPACFDDVICVAATTHRNEIINYKGEQNKWDNGEIGRIANFSSVGPRIDGCLKPDIAAPGSFVISAYNSFYEEDNPDAGDIDSDREHFLYNGRTYAWNANSGTSMSAPVVAGIIALWLQANPRLTPQDIKGVFARTARHPDPTLEYPNTLYGYGEIDAYAGLLDILGLSEIKEISHRQPCGVRFMVENRAIKAITPDGTPLGLKIFDLQGRPHENTALPSGVYAVEVLSDSPEQKGSTLIRIR